VLQAQAQQWGLPAGYRSTAGSRPPDAGLLPPVGRAGAAVADAPQLKEQFGRVLVEAMACGVPVVQFRLRRAAQRRPATPAWSFLRTRSAPSRHIWSHLLADPELCVDLARRGRERVLAHYTQAQIAAETLPGLSDYAWAVAGN